MYRHNQKYRKKLSKSGQGPPALSVRMALGALIIKERLGVTDEECVEQIRENPRGKAGCDTEFGAKLSVSLVDGYAFVDRISWDNFNECRDLQGQVNANKRLFGVYPSSVHGDRISRTRANRRFCKRHGIRLSGPRLGRPPKKTPENMKRLQTEALQARQDELDRIAIEGKFGQGKRRFGIGGLMTKLAATSKTAIALCFLVMNLEKWLAAIFLCLLFKEQESQLRICLNNFTRQWTPVKISMIHAM